MKRALVNKSGCYVYRLDGAIVAREPWSVTRNQAGNTRIVTARDASEFGVWLGLEVNIAQDGARLYHFELRTKPKGPTLKSTRYHRADGLLHYDANNEGPLCELAPQNAHFFPLMRYFTGEMIAAIKDNGGARDVIVPDIRSLTNVASVFAPLHSVRTVTMVAGDRQAFDLTGGAYETPARVYLNNEGLLMSYAFMDVTGQKWTCILENRVP
jgi:hypothetical protein